MTDLCTVVADIILWLVFRKLLKQLFGALEILLNEDFGMVVGALSAFLTESIHIVPAELANDVLEFTSFPVEAKSHIEVGTALINVSERTMLSFFTFFSHEVWAYLQVVTEITLVSVSASPHAFELVTWLYFAFVVGVWTVVRQSALAVDKFLAYSVGGKFVMVRGGSRLLSSSWSVVQGIEISLIGALLLLWVHYNNKQIISGIEIGLFGLQGEFSIPIRIPARLETDNKIKSLQLNRMKQKQSGKSKGIFCILVVLAISIAVYLVPFSNHIEQTSSYLGNRRLYTTNTTRLSIVSTYCKSGAVSVTQADRNANSGYQSTLSSYMKANATRLVVDMVNSNVGDFMTEIQINGTGTIVFISPFIIGLAFLMLAFPCLLCCCTCQQSCPPKCCRSKNPNYSNSQLTWPTVFLILVCILIVCTAIPSMTNSKSFFAEFNCQAAKFIDDFYNGNETLNQQYFFSGVSQVRKQLTSVLSPKLSQVNTQISKLNSNVGSTMNTVIANTNTALTGLKSVPRGTDYLQFTQNYNQPLDSSTTTGTFSTVLGPLIGTFGVNSTLLGSLYTYVTNNILTNLTSITTAASSVSPHLTALDMGAQITATDTGLATIQSNLDSLNSQMSNVLSLLANIDTYNINYSITFYGIILGLALLILIAIIFMKCFGMLSCRYFIYFICLFMFFLCALLFLYSIILAILMPSLYYTCQYFKNTFTTPSAFTNMIITLQGASYTALANQFAQCFGGNYGFMTQVNPTLQGYLSQLQTSVFGSYKYSFTSMTSTLNTSITTMQTSIDNIGLGHLPDFDVTTASGQAQISNFNAIADKSAFSASCPSSSFSIFYQDVWVPGLSNTYQSYVSCLNKVGIDNTTCTTGIDDTTTCPFSRCIDAFSIISTYYRGGNIATIGTDADIRYGSCPQFDSFLNNFYTNYVKLVVDNIGNTVDDASNNAKLAGRFVINAKTPINNLANEMNTNVKTLFTQVYNNLTQTQNLLSIFDPSAGLLTGLDCRLLSEDGVNAKESLCITSFNRIYFTLVTVGILAFSLFFALCCIVCFNVRHYQKSIQKEEHPGRIIPLDQTSSEIQIK